MDDEFDTSQDTGLGDDSSGVDFGSDQMPTAGTDGGFFNMGGLSSDMGILGASSVSLPRIRGGLRGNPGAMISGYGAGRIAGRAVGKLWEAAKRFGPDLVAGAAGMTAEQLLGVFLDKQPWRHRRRRRGISGRDVRTTRRVVRFVNSIQHQIGCVHTPRHHFARRRAR